MSNPKVLNQLPVNKSDTVTIPNMGEREPTTGFAKSIITTGKDPTNFISNPSPQTLRIVPSISGEESHPQVIPTPGA